MGDRIAILQEGGVLAQYATPAELLMYPASPFVEDFVGLRSRAQAPRAAAGPRHRPLEGAARPARRAGLRGPRQARRGRPRDPAGGRRRRPAAGLAVRARTPGRARARRLPLGPRADRRARRHPARRPVGPAVRRQPLRPGGRRRRRASPACSRWRRSRTRSRFLRSISPAPTELRDQRPELARNRPDAMSLLANAPLFAQLGDDFFGNREGADGAAAPATTGCAPGSSSTTSTSTGTRCGSTCCSASSRWPSASCSPPRSRCSRTATARLSPLFLAFVSVLFTIPSIAFYLILLNVTGRGFYDRGDRADGLHAGADLPQRRHRPRTRCRRRWSTSRRAWA